MKVPQNSCNDFSLKRFSYSARACRWDKQNLLGALG
jgi:hypothetical protein